jgi:hypothetical protein
MQQKEMETNIHTYIHTYIHNEPCTGASAASTPSCHNLTKVIKLVRIQAQQQLYWILGVHCTTRMQAGILHVMHQNHNTCVRSDNENLNRLWAQHMNNTKAGNRTWLSKIVLSWFYLYISIQGDMSKLEISPIYTFSVPLISLKWYSHPKCPVLLLQQDRHMLNLQLTDHTATKGKDLPLPLHVWVQVLGRESTCKIFAWF